MSNRNYQVYGLTIVAPILKSEGMGSEHASSIRLYLANLPRDHSSPFAQVPSTHFARLVVMEDVVSVGAPAREEHLLSQYLVFEANFDGDLDTYLTTLARAIPSHVDSVWKHCIGYPGVADLTAFTAYMKKCQIETTFLFVDVHNTTVLQILAALRVQSALAHFIESNQGKPATEIQIAFGLFLETLRSAPPLLPGGTDQKTTGAEEPSWLA